MYQSFKKDPITSSLLDHLDLFYFLVPYRISCEGYVSGSLVRITSVGKEPDA